MKTIALIAHDHKKKDLVAWAIKNKKYLAKFNLCATGTTGGLLQGHLGLKVKRYLSGPIGGDLQIASRICDKKIDYLIFLWDPMSPQPHDVDVKALLRIAVLHDVPTACNLATANCFLKLGN